MPTMTRPRSRRKAPAPARPAAPQTDAEVLARVRDRISFRPDETADVLAIRVGVQLQVSTVVRDALRRYALLVGEATKTLPTDLDVLALTEALRPHLPLNPHAAMQLAALAPPPFRKSLSKLTPTQCLALADLIERQAFSADRAAVAADLAMFTPRPDDTP